MAPFGRLAQRLCIALALADCLTGVTAAQSSPSPLTLEDAIRRALNTSPSLNLAAARVESVRARLDEIRGKRGPDIELRTGFGVVPNTDEGFDEGIGPFVRNDLTVTQPLFTFGKLASGRSAAALGVGAAEEQARIDRNKLVFEVTKLYSLALLARELDDLAEEASDRLGSALNKAQELFDKADGKVTQKDLARLKIFNAKLRSQALAARSGVRLSTDALAMAVGIEDPNSFELAEARLRAPESELADLDTYRDRGLAERPELLALSRGAQARQALVQLEQRRYLPDLALLGTLRYSTAPDREILAGTDSFNQFIAGAAFGLRWDFNFGAAKARVDQAEAEAHLIEAQYRLAVQGISLEIEKAYLDAVEARERVQITREGLKAARGWMVAETQLYQIGTGETEDLLTSLGAYAEAKKDNLEAIQKAIVTTAELERTSPSVDWPPPKSTPLSGVPAPLPESTPLSGVPAPLPESTPLSGAPALTPFSGAPAPTPRSRAPAATPQSGVLAPALDGTPRPGAPAPSERPR